MELKEKPQQKKSQIFKLLNTQRLDYSFTPHNSCLKCLKRAISRSPPAPSFRLLREHLASPKGPRDNYGLFITTLLQVLVYSKCKCFPNGPSLPRNKNRGTKASVFIGWPQEAHSSIFRLPRRPAPTPSARTGMRGREGWWEM